MRTKRFRLHVEGADCSFWMLLFDKRSKMNNYFKNQTGITPTDECGPAFCISNPDTRQISIGLLASFISHIGIAHEAFHATLDYASMNRRVYNHHRWARLVKDRQHWDRCEEDLANVCGSIVCEIWEILRTRFGFKEWAEAKMEDAK